VAPRIDPRRAEAIDLLYRRHRAEILRFVVREGSSESDAEDVVQSAFLDAYQALLAGNEPRQPRPWLYAIARNARRRGYRSAAARPVEPLSDELAAEERDALELRELRDAIARLPENQRSALLLRELAGSDYAEIARRLHLSVGAVQMLLFRARRTLRAELGQRRLGSLLPLPAHELAAWLSQVSAGIRTLPVGSSAGAVALLAAGATLANGGPAGRAEPAGAPLPLSLPRLAAAAPAPRPAKPLTRRPEPAGAAAPAAPAAGLPHPGAAARPAATAVVAADRATPPSAASTEEQPHDVPSSAVPAVEPEPQPAESEPQPDAVPVPVLPVAVPPAPPAAVTTTVPATTVPTSAPLPVPLPTTVPDVPAAPKVP
jgi:RNA polymerase sigma factor (sigma-70 family)